MTRHSTRSKIYCPISNQSFVEEIINSLTHGFGSLLSIVGIAFLITLASLNGNAWHIVSCSIYGATLVLLYMASTLYHSVRTSKAKQALKVVDHSCIFLFIAGSYTPFTLVSLNGAWGWSIFGVVWVLAGFGIVFKIFFIERFEKISTLVYLGMGWLILVAIVPLKESLPTWGIVWLAFGGLAYTGGVVAFVLQKIPFNHGIWHLFVIAGSVCHYVAIMLYVIPQSV